MAGKEGETGAMDPTKTLASLARVGGVVGEWRFKEKLGSGGFGEVWLACRERGDGGTREEGAVKLEKLGRSGHLEEEEKVWRSLRTLVDWEERWPLLLGSGSAGDVRWMALERLSISVSSLRRVGAYRRFSRLTTARIGVQVFRRLEELHGLGWLHLDIKPSNLCFKLSHQPYQELCLIDFGLAWAWKKEEGSRARKGLVGTLRYASIANQEGKVLGPVDDLWSAFFSLIELEAGRLFWQQLREPQNVLNSKRNSAERQVRQGNFAPEMMELYGELSKLSATPTTPASPKPDYPALMALLDRVVEAEVGGAEESSPAWDWDEDFARVKAAQPPPRPARFQTPDTHTNATIQERSTQAYPSNQGGGQKRGTQAQHQPRPRRTHRAPFFARPGGAKSSSKSILPSMSTLLSKH